MVTINEIINLLVPAKFIGDDSALIDKIDVVDSPNLSPTHLVWVNDKNIDKLKQLRHVNIICSINTPDTLFDKSCNYIIVSNPRLAFLKVLSSFFVVKSNESFISPSAFIHPSAIIGENTSIGHNTVIEENCKIGNNTQIGHNNVFYSNTVIGNEVKIGSNNTFGGIGFGYEKNEENKYELIPHIGNVTIENFVEIGNNTCIDRAVLGTTLLKEYCKIDNLVHIAHGVIIGKNSLIIANALIGGSSVVGENVWVSPSSTIINKINIGDGSIIGLGAVVLKNVADGSVMVGNPAKIINKN